MDASVSVESPLRRFRSRFLSRRSGVVSLLVLLALVTAAGLAPWLAPFDPNLTSLADRLQAPGAEHLLGTDDLGRDVLSRMLYASRISLVAGVLATAVASAIGIPLGLIAGYVGGRLDLILSRIADAILTIPALLLALAIIGALGPSLRNAMISVGIVYAPRLFRIVRGSTMAVREETYIEASRAMGLPGTRTMYSHVLPNVISPLLVQVSLSIAFAILAEAGISFLGLGAQPPTASWGAMLGRSTSHMESQPYLVIFPGLAIMITVLCLNALGDAIDESLGRELQRK